MDPRWKSIAVRCSGSSEPGENKAQPELKAGVELELGSTQKGRVFSRSGLNNKHILAHIASVAPECKSSLSGWF